MAKHTDKHGNYFLYKKDHALIAVIKRKLELETGRPVSKTEIIRNALDHYVSMLDITLEEIAKELLA